MVGWRESTPEGEGGRCVYVCQCVGGGGEVRLRNGWIVEDEGL